MVAKLFLLQFYIFGCDFVRLRKKIFSVAILRFKSFSLSFKNLKSRYEIVLQLSHNILDLFGIMALIAICKIILVFSFAGMLFIFLRVLPLFSDFKPKSVPEEKKFSFRFKARIEIIRKKIGGRFNQWGKKSAHRIKVLVLKIDNSLTSYLKKAREKEIYIEKIHLSRKKKLEKGNKKSCKIKKKVKKGRPKKRI